MVNSNYNLNNFISDTGHFVEDSDWVKEIINDNSFVFDIGARDTIIPTVNEKATYFLFEPIEYNIQRLYQTYNDRPSTVHIVEYAASDKKEEIEIYKESESINKRANFDYKWDQLNPERVKDGITEKIETIRIDEYINHYETFFTDKINSIDLLKIDVEGYEVKVLRGLGDKINIVNNIVFEYSHETLTNAGFSLKDILDLLIDKFELYVIQPDGFIYLNFKDDYDTIYSKIVNSKNIDIYGRKFIL